MGIIAEQWGIDQQVHLSVHRATGLRRLTGLIGRPELPAARALRFTRCRSVHSCFMRRSIDVVFADRSGSVLAVRELPPWRASRARHAAQIFELRAGEASRLGIVPGARLTIQRSQEGTR